MYLIFDTETTGLPKRYDAPLTASSNWPRCVQLAWQLHNEYGQLIEQFDCLVRPEGFNIPYDAERVHGISTALAERDGVSLQTALEKFKDAMARAQYLVGQNVGFDINILGAEFHRMGIESEITSMPVLDTCTECTADLLKLPGGRGGKFKLPTLTELHQYLFGQPFAEAHNASADVEATARCFLELLRRQAFTQEELDVPAGYYDRYNRENPAPIQLLGLKHINLRAESEALRKILKPDTVQPDAHYEVSLDGAPFAHLHNHTQFSVLQSTISVPDLVKAAVNTKCPQWP